MNPERFIYIDAPGIASLYAQINGQDVVETLLTMEDSRTSGWKMALSAFLGGSGESNKAIKEVKATKILLRPENMVREIVMNLRAVGTLHFSVADAIARTSSTHEPAWFEARHPFSVPPQLDQFEKMGAVVFVSSSQISMWASIHNFPTAQGGQIPIHDVELFRRLAGRPCSYLVFGSIYSNGDGFQVKPFAIHL